MRGFYVLVGIALLLLMGCVGPSYYIEKSVKGTYSMIPQTTVGGNLLGASEGTLYIEFKDEGEPLNMESKYVAGGNLDFNVSVWSCPDGVDLDAAYSKDVCGERSACEVKGAKFEGSRLNLDVTCPMVFEGVRKIEMNGKVLGREGIGLEEAREQFIFCEEKGRVVCDIQLKAVLKISQK